jgi:hypothetical protein
VIRGYAFAILALEIILIFWLSFEYYRDCVDRGWWPVLAHVLDTTAFKCALNLFLRAQRASFTLSPRLA